jgi:YD repeat-containing protein
MKNTSYRARALACALLATTAYCGLTAPAHAQTNAPPAYRNLDANGVDLTLGDYVLSFVEGSIGSGAGELALLRLRGSGGGPSQWDGLTFQRHTALNGNVTISIGRGVRSERFTGSGGSLTSAQANGATLSGGAGQYQYRSADGMVINFGDPTEFNSDGATNFCTDRTPAETYCDLVPLSIVDPNGKSVTLSWTLHSIASGNNIPQDYHHYFRLSAISNSFAYRIDFSYIDNDLPANGQPTANWFNRSGATFFNDAVGSGAQAQVSYAYPAENVIEVTDMGGRVWRFGPGTVRRPGSSSDDIVVTSGANGVTSVKRDGVTTQYSRSVSGSTATTIVTNALSQQQTVVSNLTIGRPTSITDPLSRTTSFQYDGSGRLTRTTAPEGNYVQLTLDARGNVTQTQAVAKPGSNAAPITSSASYEATCSNPVTCNQPLSTTDARGNVTNYSYDPTHGGLLSVTAPAAPNGVRPQTRYSYSLVNGEYQLTGVSACQTQSSCAGTADEVKTSLAYDSNGNVASVSSGSGDGSLTARRR